MHIVRNWQSIQGGSETKFNGIYIAQPVGSIVTTKQVHLTLSDNNTMKGSAAWKVSICTYFRPWIGDCISKKPDSSRIDLDSVQAFLPRLYRCRSLKRTWDLHTPPKRNISESESTAKCRYWCTGIDPIAYSILHSCVLKLNSYKLAQVVWPSHPSSTTRRWLLSRRIALWPKEGSRMSPRNVTCSQRFHAKPYRQRSSKRVVSSYPPNIYKLHS